MGFETRAWGGTSSITWVWSIPMGFETGDKNGKIPCARLFEVSLWDLKRRFPTWNSDTIMFEVSLWDLKHLLLATDFKNVRLFEVSLWDLKQIFLIRFFPSAPRFEVSLWDLKPKSKIRTSTRIIRLKYPYGIWNIETVSNNKYIISLKYPYGIWNFGIDLGLKRYRPFEVSLWDLKLPSLRSFDELDQVWSIPMGFETSFTFSTIIPCDGLKYPYGIWNTKEYIMKKHKFTFEVSLWDLKQCSTSVQKEVHRGLKYPYGIWNHPSNLYKNPDQRLKYPYGIWNVAAAAPKT